MKRHEKVLKLTKIYWTDIILKFASFRAPPLFKELKLRNTTDRHIIYKPFLSSWRLKLLITHVEFKYWVLPLSCTPELAWGEEPKVWGCKSAIWEKEREGVDLSLKYPGEVELVLKYPTLISWVHFKHNILDDFENAIEEIIRGKRFFNKIGEKS